MSAWGRARLASIATLLAAAIALHAGGAVARSPSASSGGPDSGAGPIVACGDGPAFPLTALEGPQGAELAGDGAARRLARAATTGEAGYVPRGGWIRVLDAPDRVMFVTWLRLPRSTGGPLLQLTVTTDSPGTEDADAWRIASAGFCWPHVAVPEGTVAVGWMADGAAAPSDTSVRVIPTGPVCADPTPVVLLTPERVAVTVLGPAAAGGCQTEPRAPISVDLGEPLGPRDLLDGASDPPTLIQAAPHPTPVPTPPIDPASIAVTAAARPTSIVASHAIADSLGSVPGLVEVQVIDALALQVTLRSATDLVLAGPPRLCLVGPFAAPDDAGLIDRCWGDPDPGGALAPVLPRDAAGHPVLRAGVPAELDAMIARGEVRCDYPPGDWHLEIVLTPLIDGHGWTDVMLPDVPLLVDAQGLEPLRELTRSESRYCGMATRPATEASPAP